MPLQNNDLLWPIFTLPAATTMPISSLQIKTKIALHSLGFTIILLVLLLFFIAIDEIPIARFTVLGLLTGQIGTIIFSRRKYIASIQQNDSTITINYFNRLLVRKSISTEKDGLDILYIKEVNWWYGKLDLISFSHGKQHLTFNCIERKLKQLALASLEEA